MNKDDISIEADAHDRILDAYNGELGEKMMRVTRERIHWVCENVTGDMILDVGCSQGIASILLGREGKKVTGVDVSQRSVDEANAALQSEGEDVRNNVSFIQEDFLLYDFHDKKFDTVIIAEVLEHLLNPQNFINKAYEVLNKNGKLVVTVPFGINDHVDHKQIYYYMGPLQMMIKYFEVTEVNILGKWIAFVGVRKDICENESSNVDAKMVERLEDGFFKIERPLVDRNLLLNKMLREKHLKLEALYKDKKEAVEKLKRSAEELKKSASYRLGYLLLHKTRSLKDIVLLPRNIYRIKSERGNTGKVVNVIKYTRAELVKRKKDKAYKKLAKEGYIYYTESLEYNTSYKDLIVVYSLHNSLPETCNGYATRSHYIVSSILDQNITIYPVTRPGFPLDIKNIGRYHNDDFSPIVDGVQYFRLNKDGYHIGKVSIPEYIENYSRMLVQFAIARKATILHGASNYINGLAIVNAAKILNIPSIYEVRGFWEITQSSRDPLYKDTVTYAMQKRLEIQACTAAVSVMALSDIVKEELVTRGVDENKIYVIPNGVDVKNIKPLDADKKLIDTFNYRKKFVVGFIGSTVDYEGLTLLVEAADKLSQNGKDNFRYLIVGDGNDLANLKKLTVAKGVSDLFCFTGRVPFEEVEKYYSIIDVACYPRLAWEVCSIVSPKKPFEAMAYGIPIISSSVKANSYFIEDEVNGVIHDCGNSDSIAEKINLLFNDAILRKKVGDRGREWVGEFRNSDKTGPMIENVYKCTLKKFLNDGEA